MRNAAIGLCTIGFLSASSATAQSLPDNMYFDGHIEITSLHTSSFDERIGRANLNFGLTPTRDNRLAIGFSLGIDAINFNDANLSETAIYPAVTFAIGNTGLLSVGVPRPVMDYGYIPEDTLAHSAGMEFLLETAGVSRSATSLLYLYDSLFIGSDIDVYGLRYDGEFGNTKIGVSYHRLSIDGSVGDEDAYSVAFQHRFGGISSFADTIVFGGVESVDVGTNRLTSYNLGIEASSDKLRTGLIFSHSEFSFEVDTINLYAEYKISDSFSAAGSILNVDVSGGSSNIYGVGVEYQFLNGGYVNANYSDQDLLGSDAFYEISLGWRF